MSTMGTGIPTSNAPDDPGGASRPSRESRGHIGWVVAGSLGIGLVAALLLAAAPFISPEDDDVTGAVLSGFALGWAALALLSMRLTDRPQRWAAEPAVSTNSSHRVVEGASHAGLILDEQYAKTTTRAVLDVVDSVHTADPLAR